MIEYFYERRLMVPGFRILELERALGVKLGPYTEVLMAFYGGRMFLEWTVGRKLGEDRKTLEALQKIREESERAGMVAAQMEVELGLSTGHVEEIHALTKAVCGKSVITGFRRRVLDASRPTLGS